MDVNGLKLVIRYARKCQTIPNKMHSRLYKLLHTIFNTAKNLTMSYKCFVLYNVYINSNIYIYIYIYVPFCVYFLYCLKKLMYLKTYFKTQLNRMGKNFIQKLMIYFLQKNFLCG